MYFIDRNGGAEAPTKHIEMRGQTDRQIDRQTDRQADCQLCYINANMLLCGEKLRFNSLIVRVCQEFK